MADSVELSLAEARRLAVSAQGFDGRPERGATAEDILKLTERIHAFQIDSVNVLVRAHYMPAFARLGAYPRAALDELAYSRRELFEYWGHAACLLPLRLYPLLRYRMDRWQAYLEAQTEPHYEAALAEVQERGPLAAGDLAQPGQRSGKWWGWGSGKLALEILYSAGVLAIAGRRRFERLYDLTERVIPEAARKAPAPPREFAMKELIYLGAQACGVGTLKDIAGYFYVDSWWERPRMPDGKRAKPVVKRLFSEMVDEGRLVPAQVEGWPQPAYVHADRKPAAAPPTCAVVTPFDSLVWDRARIARLFGMAYTIEIYTPPPKRVYGYYVCPILQGDALVGRLDLKADRQAGALLVRAAHLEPGRQARDVAPTLAAELRRLAEWLELANVEVNDRGDLAPALRRQRKAAHGS